MVLKFSYGLSVTIAPLKIQGKLILRRGISQMSLNRTVVLVGMMGSGKTAVGRALATALDVPFLDSDHEISKAANRSISEIFERDGNDFFRLVETRVIKRLLCGRPCVLATGGGAFMSTENRALIANSGISVFLNVDLEVLWERVRDKKSRPLLNTTDSKATLYKIFEDRKDEYSQADLSITSNHNSSIAETARKLLSSLSQCSDVLSSEKSKL